MDAVNVQCIAATTGIWYLQAIQYPPVTALYYCGCRFQHFSRLYVFLLLLLVWLDSQRCVANVKPETIKLHAAVSQPYVSAMKVNSCYLWIWAEVWTCWGLCCCWWPTDSQAPEASVDVKEKVVRCHFQHYLLTLTLWCSLLPYGYKASCDRPG